ncbi:hypothetical protein WS54_18575 [Burkholderia sp. NRF60-BP8]|nr:hypothetical protein WS54_18575 [Burkholderia sp. NRF60-BP8]
MIMLLMSRGRCWRVLLIKALVKQQACWAWTEWLLNRIPMLLQNFRKVLRQVILNQLPFWKKALEGHRNPISCITSDLRTIPSVRVAMS